MVHIMLSMYGKLKNHLVQPTNWSIHMDQYTLLQPQKNISYLVNNSEILMSVDDNYSRIAVKMCNLIAQLSFLAV